MTHPLLANFERFIYDARPPLGANQSGNLGLAYGYLRHINGYLIEHHSDLFDSRFFMTSWRSTIQGHTLRTEATRLKVIFDFETAQYNGAETIYLNETADRLAEELRSHVPPEGSAFAYLIPVTAGGVIIDPETSDFRMTLMTYRAVMPLNEPCPPCDVSRDADLTKFGLPPLK